ncbi:MAG: Xaa-Pro dipeptidase [Deltaproteobacteria bacterium]|nr:Xaa-Pro dipeptidase [Deltaproteobacteria bacterium]
MSDSELAGLYRSHVATLSKAYRSAVERAGFDTLLLCSGRARIQSHFDDQYWPHKPTPMFAHWLPLCESDAFLLLGKDRTLHRTPQTSYWESPALAPGDHFWGSFAVRDDSGASITGQDLGKLAIIAESPADVADLKLDGVLNPPELVKLLGHARALKTDYERHCIGEANRIASRGHDRLAELFAGGPISEHELNLEYLRATAQDSWETPYGNIVALGAHAAVLHHVHYDKQARAAGSLLVDAGATYMGYASDITRTHNNGKSATFKALVAGVQTLQDKMCEELAADMRYEVLHDRAHDLLAALLAELDIVRMDPEEMVESKTTRAFFPHGLGHSLGIQVHDVGCKDDPPTKRNPHLRTTAVTQVGHVFTIEPGCYFIPGLLEPLKASTAGSSVNWPLVEELKELGGVRIEDNVAISESGTVNLTRDNWANRE